MTKSLKKALMWYFEQSSKNYYWTPSGMIPISCGQKKRCQVIKKNAYFSWLYVYFFLFLGLRNRHNFLYGKFKSKHQWPY